MKNKKSGRCRFFYCTAEHITGVAFKGSSVGVVNIADESCGFSLVAVPWKDYEGVKIGMQTHIAFLDSYKAVN